MTVRRCIPCLLLVLALAAPARAQWTWEPVTDAERGQSAGVVDPQSGAEGLFLKIRVEDTFDGQDIKSILDQYVRVKIFTADEAQRLTTVRIPHPTRGVRISDVAARTILADGTVLDVPPASIQDVRIARREGREWKALTFALPRVAPGSIIEWRWREVHLDALADGIIMDVQRDFPLRRADLEIKPLELSDWRLQIMPFALNANVPAESVRGWFHCTAENVRALPDEPYSPPGRRQRGFVYAYYLRTEFTNADDYWGSVGSVFADNLLERLGEEGEIAAVARSIVGDATADSVKVQRLVRWCRANIRDITSEEFIQRQRRNRNIKVSQVLESRTGTDLDAAQVLYALIRSVGLSPNLVLLESRAGMPFRKSVMRPASLSVPAVMVRCVEDEHLCVARGRGIAWNGLPWEAEGMRGILCGSDSSGFITSQVQSRSSLERVANVTLASNGDLEGKLITKLGGHFAEEWWSRVTQPSDQESVLRELSRWNREGLTCSGIEASAAGADSDTVIVTASFRWPGFASVTEKRILLQPALWSARAPVPFARESRQTPVMFPYCWRESDSLVFRLPPGTGLEAVEPQPPMELLPLLQHVIWAGMDDRTHELTLHRIFDCGTVDHTTFSKANYPSVREGFQSVAKRDQFTLTLTKTAP